MKKIEFYLDQEKLIKTPEDDSVFVYKEELDSFEIGIDFTYKDKVRLDLGQGHITIDEDLFESALIKYRNDRLRQTLEYHIKEIYKFTTSEIREEKSYAKATLRSLMKELKD